MLKQQKNKSRDFVKNFLLILSSILIALFLVEIFLRTKSDACFGAAIELSWMRDVGDSNSFTIDPDFGFRPVLGNEIYNKFGTRCNNYALEKRKGVTRVLFIGDSVVARGELVDAIEKNYGTEKFEYWNAGVESFNTIQEFNFYKKYNYLIKPDHVILVLHNNDLETTPIAFINNKKEFIVYSPNAPLAKPNRFLFIHSYLYRFLLGRNLKGEYNKGGSIAKEVRNSLGELRDVLARDNISLTILVFPLMKPYEKWDPDEKTRQDILLYIVRNLQIRHFDLMEPLQQAIAAKVPLEKNKGDYWHPTSEASSVFAEYLFRNSFL